MANDTDQVVFFVGEVLERTARKYPGKAALISKEGQLSFEVTNERVTCLASWLQHEGVKRGDRVALLLPNSLAFALSYYATQRAGAVTVVLDARLKGKELLGVLQDADLRLLITHARLKPEVEEVLAELKPIPTWVVEGEGEESFKKKLSTRAGDFSPPKLKPEDDAIILYTSGTTGEPKGVVLDHINLAQFPVCMKAICHTGPDEVLGCILPMSHISGPIQCNEIADKGGTLVIFDQMNPVTLLEGIQAHRVTIFHAVPIVFQLLLGVPNLKDYDTRSVEVAAMMGTTIPVSLMQAFKSAQPHVKVIQGYGLTETSPLITFTELDKAEAKMASMGRAVPGVEIKIVNPNDEEVPEGEPGEIITRGPHLMKGYFRKPQVTAERIRGGWLYTGDIGRRDRDGYYYHLGRKDDMIITGGLNVYPTEVENMLCEFPHVQEAVVFPIPDAKRGSVIGAAVVLRPGSETTEKELLTLLRGNLANFKVPHRIAIHQSLPRTSVGKVIRDPALLLSERGAEE